MDLTGVQVDLLKQLVANGQTDQLIKLLSSNQNTPEWLQQLLAGDNADAVLEQLLSSDNADELIARLLAGENIDDLMTQLAPNINSAETISIFSAGLNPVATTLVTANGVTVRQRPWESSAPTGVLEQGEVSGVFGTDAGGNWLYIAALTGVQGWVPAEVMRVTGTLAEAPVLPPDPIGAALARASSPPSESGATVSRQTIDIDGLESAATARVNNDVLNLRQRPGSSYKLLDTLALDDEVTILALNRDKEWALVKTAGEQLGWGSMDFLDVDGSLADVSQVRTLAPDQDHPANQVAPMVLLSGSAEAVAVVSNSPAADGGPAAAGIPAAATIATDSASAVPGNTLAVITTAVVNTKTDLRRGPGTSYGTLQTLTVDEIVSVRAVNQQQDWAVVQATNSRVGWIPLNSLTLENSVDNAPQVLTAWVKNNELEVRGGPGIFHDVVGTLALNDLVSVLALNEGRNWALVETLSGGQGWITLKFLDIAGSLADIPQISSPPVAESLASAPALPAPSGPPSGQLVFQTASGGNIMLINADGTGLHYLTNGIDPALSPDGKMVAFTRWAGDTGTLWVINVDGTDERAVLGNTRKAKGPDWSPDGRQIALNFQHGGRLEAIEKCQNFDGSFPNIPRNATNIAIRRDGRRMFICWTEQPDAQWSLRVVNVTDGAFDDLYGGIYAFRPAWDPSQPWRIVSDSGDGLLAVDINRAEYREPLTDEMGDGSPAFSPDGRFIAMSTKTQNSYDIYRMNADGNGRVRLTQTPVWVPVQPESDGRQWNNVAPVWSPDGSRIAFLTDRNSRWEIWVMNADGSEQHPMFSDKISSQLDISYSFVDERVLSWR